MRAVLRILRWAIVAPLSLFFQILHMVAEGIINYLAELRGFFSNEPEDVPLADTFQKASQDPRDFLRGILAHLEELRGHLINSLAALTITSALAFAYNRQILDILTRPLGGIQELEAVDVTEPLSVVMRVSLVTGLAIALPYISFELLRFIGPGISRRSRLLGLFGIPLTVILFASGAIFTYLYLLEPSITILVNFSGIPVQSRPTSYINFVTGLMFWLGVAFEAPLVAYLLSAMGILPAELLKDNWRIAIIILAVLAAAITPTTDPITMSLVLGPLLFLYFLSIGLAYLGKAQRRARRQT